MKAVSWNSIFYPIHCKIYFLFLIKQKHSVDVWMLHIHSFNFPVNDHKFYRLSPLVNTIIWLSPLVNTFPHPLSHYLYILTFLEYQIFATCYNLLTLIFFSTWIFFTCVIQREIWQHFYFQRSFKKKKNLQNNHTSSKFFCLFAFFSNLNNKMFY